jgi:hypothetical protein
MVISNIKSKSNVMILKILILVVVIAAIISGGYFILAPKTQTSQACPLIAPACPLENCLEAGKELEKTHPGCDYTSDCKKQCQEETTRKWVPYAKDRKCPPGYIDYGMPLQCVTPEYMEYCKSHPCPVCLAGNTLIDTPDGAVPIKDLQVGMPIWTTDLTGNRVAGSVVATSKVLVPKTHQMIHLILEDGRELLVSPGHLTIDGRRVGDLSVNDFYDNARVVSVDRVGYNDEATYDVLPSGETGFYWANGILLKTTLSRERVLK